MADANPSSAAPGPPPGDPQDTTRGGERGERAIAAIGAGIRGLGRWAVTFVRDSIRAWRYLDGEQRVAAVACGLLIVSTFGPFSFVEGSIVLVALAVLLLLKKRGDGRSFHLPFGDGAVIMAAGAWSALLIAVRLFDRPLGQNLLALVCATLLALAGLRTRLRRPVDDMASERSRARTADAASGVEIEFATERLPGAGTAAARRAPAPPQPPAAAPPPRAPSRPPAPSPPRPAARPPAGRPDPDFDLPDAPAPPAAAPAPPPPPPPAEAGAFRARPASPSDAPPPSDRVPRRPRDRG
jgi:hypothetical protein